MLSRAGGVAGSQLMHSRSACVCVCVCVRTPHVCVYVCVCTPHVTKLN